MKKISIFLLAALVLCALSSCATQEKSTSELPTQNQTETTAQGLTQESTGESTQESTEESTQGETQSPTENPQSAEAQAKYAEALEFLASGKYQEAYDILNGIKDYPAAQEKLKNFFYVPSKKIRTDDDGDVYVDKYTYDNKGNLIKIDYVRTGETYFEEFEYDQSGNLLIGYSFWGEPLTYVYSDEGKRQKAIAEDGAIYYYNDQGQVIRREDKAEKHQFTYENSGNNQITFSLTEFHGDEIDEIEKYRYTFQYNDKNQLKELIFEDVVPEEYADIYEYTVIFTYIYNDNGTLQKIIKQSYSFENWGDGPAEKREFTVEYEYTDYKLYYNTNSFKAQSVLSENEIYYYDYLVIYEEIH